MINCKTGNQRLTTAIKLVLIILVSMVFSNQISIKMAMAANNFSPAIYTLLLNEEPNLNYYLNDYQLELTDYKEAPLRPASPKFVLASTDGVNFEFRGKPGKTNYYFARVKGSNSTSQIAFYMVESSTPGLYRNPRPIRLSDKDSMGSSFDTIKFRDEDTLTTTISAAGEGVIASKSIMLDKGEFASCGISIFFSDATRVKNNISALNWVNAGYQEFSDAAGNEANPDHLLMQNFIKDAGDNTAANGEADFLHFTSHGDHDGRLVDDDSPWGEDIIIRPSEINTDQDMNSDLEWVFINACSTLDQDDTGLDNWMGVLKGTIHPVHGLLGFYEPVSANLSVEIDSFFSRLGSSESPETYLNAFFNAMTSGSSDEPCAMVAHVENIDDTLKVLTQDSSNNQYRYYWYNLSSFIDKSKDDTIIKTADGTSVASKVDLDSFDYKNIKSVILKQKEFSTYPDNYQQTKLKCGMVILNSGDKIANKNQDEFTALAKAEEALTASFGPLPDDAYGPQSGSLKMQDFTWQDNSALRSNEIVDIARTFKYTHYINGIPVVGDMLAATISGNEVIKLKGNWHEYVSTAATSDITPDNEKILAASVALDYALTGLKSGTDIKAKNAGSPTLEEAELCYYGLQNDSEIKTYLPTWRFRFKENNKLKNVFVDAYSGEIHPDKEIAEAFSRVD